MVGCEGQHEYNGKGGSGEAESGTSWSSWASQCLRKRNMYETTPYTLLILEYEDRYQEATTATREAEQLRIENAELLKENELLRHDLSTTANGKKGGVGVSAPRVKDLEEQLEKAKKELAEATRIHARVLKRYEDDLTAAQSTVESLKNKLEATQKIRERLEQELQETKARLEGTQQSLLSTQNDLTHLAEEAKQRSRDILHVKAKSVRQAADEIKENLPVSLHQAALQSFDSLRATIDDALKCAGSSIELDVRAALKDLGGYLQSKGVMGKWHMEITNQLLAYQEVLLEKETWQPPSPGAVKPASSSHVLSLFSQFTAVLHSLDHIFLPKANAWHLWRSICQTFSGITQNISEEVGSHPADAGFGQVILRLNTLVEGCLQFTSVMAKAEGLWKQQPAILASDSDPFAITEMIHCTERILTDMASSLVTRASLLSMAAVKEHFHHLYCINMGYYKKYKNNSDYNKTNKHLTPATSHSMSGLLGALGAHLRTYPITSCVLSCGYDPNLAFNQRLLKDIAAQFLNILLDGGDTRWFYPEQSESLLQDVQLIEKFFKLRGMSDTSVAESLVKVKAIVTMPMAQPTACLIEGGGICVAYKDLPDDSSTSVWSKRNVRKILAHRKDKAAKKFCDKHRAELRAG